MTMNPLMVHFADQPAMIAPELMGQVRAHLATGAGHPDFQALMDDKMVADDGFWPAADDWRAKYRPYVVSAGILQIPVAGILLNRFGFSTGWATGYEYIQRAFERGLEDDNVRGIALVIHSPGGLVAGNQELVDKMYERRAEKPLRAFACDAAYSAAYNIASVAPDGITVSRSGGVGSIGVMTTHVDWSKWNDNFGIDYTFIFAGKHKVEGNPEEPLSDDAKARIQERVDELYAVFVSSVARNRGMEEQAIRDTEALTYTAPKALAAGLADTIGSLDDAMSAFAGFLDDQSDNTGEDEMAETANTSAVDQAALDQAAATARSEGAAAEQARIGAILGSDEAKGRESLAQHFAFKTGMSADDAKAALAAATVTAAAPAPEPAPAATTFADAMAQDNPEVGAGAPPAQQQKADGQPDVAALRALAGSIGMKGYDRPETVN